MTALSSPLFCCHTEPFEASLPLGCLQFGTSLNAITLGVLLLCTGCMVPGAYFTPHGQGTLEKNANLVFPIYDRLTVQLGDGVILSVHAEALIRRTDLFISLSVPEGHWVQLTSNSLMVVDAAARQRREVVIDQLASCMLTNGRAETGVHRPTKRLEGGEKYARSFVAFVTIEHFSPKQFELIVPKFIVDDRPVALEPITFHRRHGIFFYIETGP